MADKDVSTSQAQDEGETRPPLEIEYDQDGHPFVRLPPGGPSPTYQLSSPLPSPQYSPSSPPHAPHRCRHAAHQRADYQVNLSNIRYCIDFERSLPQKDDGVCFVKNGGIALGSVMRINYDQKWKQVDPYKTIPYLSGSLVSMDVVPTFRRSMRCLEEVCVVDRTFLPSDTVIMFKNKFQGNGERDFQRFPEDDCMIGQVINTTCKGDVMVLPSKQLIVRNVNLCQVQGSEMINLNDTQNYIMYEEWIGNVRGVVDEVTLLYRDTYRLTVRDEVPGYKGVRLQRRDLADDQKNIIPGEVVTLMLSEAMGKYAKWERDPPAFLARRKKRNVAEPLMCTVEKVETVSLRVDWLHSPSSMMQPSRVIGKENLHKVAKIDLSVNPHALVGDRVRVPSDESFRILTRKEYNDELCKEYKKKFVKMKHIWPAPPGPLPTISSILASAKASSSTEKSQTATSVPDENKSGLKPAKLARIPESDEARESPMDVDDEAEPELPADARVGSSSELSRLKSERSASAPPQPSVASTSKSVGTDCDEQFSDWSTDDSSSDTAGNDVLAEGESSYGYATSKKLPRKRAMARVRKVPIRRRRVLQNLPVDRSVKQLLGEEFYGEVIFAQTFVDVEWMDGTISREVPGWSLMPADPDLDQQDHLPGGIVIKKDFERQQLDDEFGVILKTNQEERSCIVRWFHRKDFEKNEVVQKEDEECTLFDIMRHHYYSRQFLGSYGVNLKRESKELRNVAYQIIEDLKNGKQRVRYINGEYDELWPFEVTPIPIAEDGQSDSGSEMGQNNDTFNDTATNTDSAVEPSAIPSLMETVKKRIDSIKSDTAESLRRLSLLLERWDEAGFQVTEEMEREFADCPSQVMPMLKSLSGLVTKFGSDVTPPIVTIERLKSVLTKFDENRPVVSEERAYKFISDIDKDFAQLASASEAKAEEIIQEITNKLDRFEKKRDGDNEHFSDFEEQWKTLRSIANEIDVYGIGSKRIKAMLSDSVRKRLLSATLEEEIIEEEADEGDATDKSVEMQQEGPSSSSKETGTSNPRVHWPSRIELESIEFSADGLVAMKMEGSSLAFNMRRALLFEALRVGTSSRSSPFVEQLIVKKFDEDIFGWKDRNTSRATMDCFVCSLLLLDRLGLLPIKSISSSTIADLAQRASRVLKTLKKSDVASAFTTKNLMELIRIQKIVDDEKNYADLLKMYFENEFFSHAFDDMENLGKKLRASFVKSYSWLEEHFNPENLGESNELVTMPFMMSIVKDIFACDRELKRQAKKTSAESTSCEEKIVVDGDVPMEEPAEVKPPKEEKKGTYRIVDEGASSNRFYSQRSTLSPLFHRRFMKEQKMLVEHLPPGIHAVSYSDRLDLMSFMIIGPEGTPFESTPFVFDLRLPDDFPQRPPEVHYESMSAELLNPNLYVEGKVCLSLLGTWSGEGVETWQPGKSNLLQVLLSIQGLILVPEPYFNEAGYEPRKALPEMQAKSKRYNEMAMINSLDYMANTIMRRPAAFDDIIREHALEVWPLLKEKLTAWCGDDELPAFPVVGSRGFKLALKKSIARLERIVSSLQSTAGGDGGSAEMGILDELLSSGSQLIAEDEPEVIVEVKTDWLSDETKLASTSSTEQPIIDAFATWRDKKSSPDGSEQSATSSKELSTASVQTSSEELKPHSEIMRASYEATADRILMDPRLRDLASAITAVVLVTPEHYGLPCAGTSSATDSTIGHN